MDTIFALSSAPGKAGVAVIRVSGMEAKETLSALGVNPLPAPRAATLVTLRNMKAVAPSGPERDQSGIIDKGLVLYFPAPHSFTGEEVVEYHIHGGRAVIRQMLAVFTTLTGLRPAEPGEFTRRAFMNGKMDLTAAEALADLIDAETESQRKQALRIMQGEAADFYDKLRFSILHALAYLEAYIDFPDEDIPEQVLSDLDKEVDETAALIERHLVGNAVSERIREGITVAILGAPNVGKSSLMNLLAKRDVAIVSEIAGTTRDVIEVHLDISGYCVILSDTAGIRENAGSIEQEGIRRSFERARSADIRIVMLDAGASDQWSVARELEAHATDHKPQATLFLLNKTDIALPSPLPVFSSQAAIPVSVKERTGLDAFLQELERLVTSTCAPESSFITRSRHRVHMTRALEHLRAYGALKNAGLELRCEALRRAATEIGAITGKIAVDELLGHIFSSFCIGK